MVFLGLILSLNVFAAPPGDWTYVARKLSRAGLGGDFAAALKRTYEPGHLETVVELNVLLFLRQRDDHGPQANDDGAARVADFLSEHAEPFARAERRYHVDPAVIAGLLFIESRFGANVGRFHAGSVFVDLLQADRPEVLTHLQAAAAPKFRPRVSARQRREIKRRAAVKVAWALSELRALKQIWTRDRTVLRRLRGSFAGAIGMPQFLPSSYLKYARAAKDGVPPDLSRTEDAIASVANYLKASGWRHSPRRALFAYNHSHDYARAILKLAAAARAVRRTPSAARR